ncbi:AT-hook motif nuclear-localized protein 1-like protein, partial [Tanacetum coccineum]
DFASKINSFSRYGPHAICVLSGGTVTYEGGFEILKLSRSFTHGESEGVTLREGGMSIALSSPGGRVVGGIHSCLLKFNQIRVHSSGKQIKDYANVADAVEVYSFLSRSSYDIERKNDTINRIRTLLLPPVQGIHVMMKIANDTIGAICQACVGKFRTISPSKYPPPHSNKDSLWVDWIKVMRLKNKIIWTIKQDPNASYGWNQMLELRDRMRKHVKYKIGDGKSIFFWHDKWWDCRVLREKNPHYILQRDFDISDLKKLGNDG